MCKLMLLVVDLTDNNAQWQANIKDKSFNATNIVCNIIPYLVIVTNCNPLLYNNATSWSQTNKSGMNW